MSNRSHPDGSLTIDNVSVQRLLDYGMLHYTDEGWYVGQFPPTNAPSDRDGGGAMTARPEGIAQRRSYD